MKFNKRKILAWVLVSPAVAFILISFGYILYIDYKLFFSGIMGFIVFFGVIKGIFMLGEESVKDKEPKDES